jgi:hypothetical protein
VAQPRKRRELAVDWRLTTQPNSHELVGTQVKSRSPEVLTPQHSDALRATQRNTAKLAQFGLLICGLTVRFRPGSPFSRMYLVALSYGDVFNQEADHSFTFAIGGARIVPQLRKVRGQGQDLRPLPVAHRHLVRLPLTVAGLLRLRERTQLRVPFRFERRRHESIVRVDAEKNIGITWAASAFGEESGEAVVVCR